MVKTALECRLFAIFAKIFEKSKEIIAMKNEKSKVWAWLEAARPRTLPASLSPVILACALAYRDGVFQWIPALFCVGVALLAQIASNFAND